MNVREMHYAFKQTMNRADSQQQRNLRPMEIDWYLNAAQIEFIKTIINPKKQFILEINQRSIDDISTIIFNSSITPTHSIVHQNRYECQLNDLNPDMMYYISAEAMLSKQCCEDSIIAKVFIMKHSELFKNNSFNRSSWDWREITGVFEEDRKLILFTDGDNNDSGTFTIGSVNIDYVKKPQSIFYGGYNTMDGELTPTDNEQDCELPENVHSDIVDIAAMLASSNLMNPDIQIKMNKIQTNNQ